MVRKPTDSDEAPDKDPEEEPAAPRKRASKARARREASPETVAPEEPVETQQTAEPAETHTEPPDAETESPQESEPATVYDILVQFASILTLFAWQRLGLVVDPFTGKIQRDLSQARVAIDTLAGLVDQIGDHVIPEQQRAFRATLADLRINFVEQSKAL